MTNVLRAVGEAAARALVPKRSPTSRLRQGSRGARRAAFGFAVAAAILLGVLDWVTGPEYSLDIFYLFPVAFVVWYVGLRPAFFMSLFAAAVWLLADIESLSVRLSPVVNLWNTLVRLLLLLAASYAIGQVRVAIDREKEIAREIQEGLLPVTMPEVPGLGIAARWRPAFVISGDYYDAIASPGRLAACVADVSGKGVPAALLMANLQAAFRLLSLENLDPAALCARLNAFVARNVPTATFVTLFVAVVHNEARLLRYVNAGHNPPVLVRRDGSRVRLTEGGPVLGVFPDAAFAQGEVALAPGDRLAVYTDGVTEAAGRRGEEYGEERLAAAVTRNAALPAERLAEALLDDLDRFKRGEYRDDVTLLVLSVE